MGSLHCYNLPAVLHPHARALAPSLPPRLPSSVRWSCLNVKKAQGEGSADKLPALLPSTNSRMVKVLCSGRVGITKELQVPKKKNEETKLKGQNNNFKISKQMVQGSQEVLTRVSRKLSCGQKSHS